MAGIYDASAAFQRLRQDVQPPQQQQQQQQAQQPMQAQEGVPMDPSADPTSAENEEMLNEELTAKYGEPANPDEQKAYEEFVLKGMEYLYEPDKFTQLRHMMQNQSGQQKSSEEVIGSSAAQLVQRVDEELGGATPEDVLIPAGNELIELMVELADNKQILRVNQKTPTRASEIMTTELMQKYDIDQENLSGLSEMVDPQDMQRVADVSSLANKESNPQHGLM